MDMKVTFAETLVSCVDFINSVHQCMKRSPGYDLKKLEPISPYRLVFITGCVASGKRLLRATGNQRNELFWLLWLCR